MTDDEWTRLSANLECLDAGRSRDDELALFLAIARQEFEDDQSTTLAAYHALAFGAAYYWHDKTKDPPDFVSVPWWAVQAIAIGFRKYADAQEEDRITSFGEAMGLEGGGQGRRPRITAYQVQQRDRRIALNIAARRIRDGWKVEDAITEIAEATSLSTDTIRKIWNRLGKHAQGSVRMLHAKKGA